MRWLRFYTDVVDDWKMTELTDKEYRIFTYLLCIASEEEKEGLIESPLNRLAWRFRMSEGEIESTIEKLKSLNIMSDNGDGYQLLNWDRRQFKSDNVTARTRKHKEKETFQGTEGERSGERSGERTRDRDRNRDRNRDRDRDKDNIPREKIVNLYHGILQELPTVKQWPDRRQKALKARWNEDPKRQNLEWWKKYFKYVRGSPFLMGQKGDFKADIDFLISPKLLNVIEGRYHRE